MLTAPPIAKTDRKIGLEQVFASVEASSCPYTLNFHMHTLFSDGQMRPADIVEQAIAIGVSHLAITDHHSVQGYLVALQQLQKLEDMGHHNLPTLWTGIEINASLLFTEVHILGYGFDPFHSGMEPYLQSKTTAGMEYQALSVISALHDAGGMAVLAHPARYRRSAEELITAAASVGIDGVETYYCYENCDPWQPSMRHTEQVRGIVNNLGLFHTCGTDSHGLKITRRI